MKKEIIYIIVPILLVSLGLIYKIVFLSESIEKTQELVNINYDLNSKYDRDITVQEKIGQIVSKYQFNLRGDKSYGDTIVEFLEILEGYLKNSEIKYNANDINYEPEKTDYKGGTTSIVVSINFITNYSNLMNFVSMIEKSDHIINISSIKILRKVPEKEKDDTDKDMPYDGFNVKANINCYINLEFIKYL